MTRPNDGGPAFPAMKEVHAQEEISAAAYNARLIPGMSLRAYLAGKAMQGLVAGITNLEVNGIIENRPKGVSELAVLYADTLLAELEKDVKAPREPKFKDGEKVRTWTWDNNGSFSGKVGIVKSSIDESIHGWVYRVSFPVGDDVLHEKDLEAAGVEREKPAPKFKMGEPVWVKKGVGAKFAEKVALVSESRYEPSGKWAYKVWIPLGGGPGREYGWYFEDSVEAIDMRGKDE